MKRSVSLPMAFILLCSATMTHAGDLPARLKQLDSRAIPKEDGASLDEMLARSIRARVHAAHREHADAFDKVRTLDDWKRFRDSRLTVLRRSLGWSGGARVETPVMPRSVGTIEGEGYVIEKLVFETTPGRPITANLYRPAKATKAMPGLILLHSFFHPKSQPELQDFGVNGALAGCAVLVPDILGHGERRQHPFVDAKSYHEKFNVPRQDYYMRSLLGLQLDVAGESLMGWFVADTLRCVDYLVQRQDIDHGKVVVLGAVAAGGDIAGVAAALDTRVAASVPYNYGGPEPESPLPIPAEGELTFPYGSGGHWDSTRRLRNAARDGFLPWVVVGATAPRRLIYAHEFAWDREHDPVWKRLQKIFDLHKVPKHLGAAHGEGSLFGKPEGTGCGNIGAYHRKTLAPLLREWFDIRWPEKEVQVRRTEAELRCLTPKLIEELKPRPVHESAAEIAKERLDAARKRLASLKGDERRAQLRKDWSRLLGGVDPKADPKRTKHATEKSGDITIERTILEVEPGIVVPLLLLLPPRKDNKPSVVLAVSQQGKGGFLTHRAADVAALLENGVAVCLPDVRGTGETRPAGDKRGRPAGFLRESAKSSGGVLLANESLMLGETQVGARLRDLRSVVRYLRGHDALNARRLTLWGDSFSQANSDDATLIVPFDAPKYPSQSEPLGGLLALLGALYEDDVCTITIRGGLLSYHALLSSSFLHVPADAVVPGAATVGDLPDIAAAIAPRPLALIETVNGLNRLVPQKRVESGWEAVKTAYDAGNSSDRLRLQARPARAGEVAAWIVESLKTR